MNGKLAKKIRKDIKDLKQKLASELKGLINELPLKSRIALAWKIILKKEW